MPQFELDDIDVVSDAIERIYPGISEQGVKAKDLLKLNNRFRQSKNYPEPFVNVISSNGWRQLDRDNPELAKAIYNKAINAYASAYLYAAKKLVNDLPAHPIVAMMLSIDHIARLLEEGAFLNGVCPRDAFREFVWHDPETRGFLKNSEFDRLSEQIPSGAIERDRKGQVPIIYL